jgi:hypothetical protein
VLDDDNDDDYNNDEPVAGPKYWHVLTLPKPAVSNFLEYTLEFTLFLKLDPQYENGQHLLSKMKFSSQTFIAFFPDFCIINSMVTRTVTQSQTFHPTAYQDSTASYQYTHWLLLPSSHPVTSAVLVGCVENIFVPCRHGEEAPHNTTVFLSTQIH